jgi:hypothetical protein
MTDTLRRLAAALKLPDSGRGKPPTGDVFDTATGGAALSTRGIALDSLAARGGHAAVCGSAPPLFADLAKHTGGSADAACDQLVAGTIGNCQVVSVAIVAVSRAQERGDTFSYVG